MERAPRAIFGYFGDDQQWPETTAKASNLNLVIPNEMAYNTKPNAIMETETTTNSNLSEIEEEWLEATKNCSNSIIPTSEELTSKQVVIIILLGVITLITIVANSFVLYIFFVGRRRLRSPTNLLLANLAVADLLVGLLVMPLLAGPTILDDKWIFGDLACEAFDYIHFLLCGISMWSIFGIGLERFIGVSRPLQYKHLITRRRTMILIMFIWIAAFGLTSGPLTYWPKSMSGISTLCNVNLGRHFLLFIVLVVYWIPVAGTLIIYLLVYRHAVTPFISSQGGWGSSNKKSDDGKEAKRRQIRLTKSIAIVTGTIFLLFGPVFMVKVIIVCGLPYFSVDLLYITCWIRYCCSTINPFLYGLAVPGYRQEVKERFFGVSKMEDLMENSRTQAQSQIDRSDHQEASKTIEEQPKVISDRSKSTAPQPNKTTRFCTLCGFLMKDFVAEGNAQCDKCQRKIMCASWTLPVTWGNSAYFICPNCPAIRFFDGAQPCFCQNCSHKFAPVQTRSTHERLSSLKAVSRKPPQQIPEVSHIPPNILDINHGRHQERIISEDRAKVIRRLKYTVEITPYVEDRRSQLVSISNNFLGIGTDNKTNSVSLRELEEIMAQIEQTIGMDIDDDKEEQ